MSGPSGIVYQTWRSIRSIHCPQYFFFKFENDAWSCRIIRHGRKFTRLNVRRMSHPPGIVSQTSRSIRSIHWYHFFFLFEILDSALRVSVIIFYFLIRKFWISASYMSADPRWCRENTWYRVLRNTVSITYCCFSVKLVAERSRELVWCTGWIFHASPAPETRRVRASGNATRARAENATRPCRPPENGRPARHPDTAHAPHASPRTLRSLEPYYYYILF